MNRITLLCLGLTAAAQLSALEKPNVVFILADDLGWADTTLYGHTEFYQSPNLERLAARGMTFDRAYTASPLCSPTRSAILTGLHPARTGLTTPNCHRPEIQLRPSVPDSAAADRKRLEVKPATRIDPKIETIADRLQNEGYATGHFGKWHLGAAPFSPLENGFDVDIPHWHGPGPAGSFVAPWKFPEFKEAYPNEHIEDRMGDEAVNFIEAHKDEPFFLNYWQFSVHAPFDAKANLIEKHRARIDPKDEQRSPTYAAMVESLDDNVGKVLDALDRFGLAENTIVIFYSDNGGNMYNEVDGTTPTANRPLRGGKGNNWDGGVRVPGVVVWPGVTEPGSRSDELITSTDFFPTLLEMLSLESGRSFDGVSIVPALRGGSLEREAIFTYFPHSTGVPDTLPPSTAVYQGDWKLLRLFNTGDSGEDTHRLFNLAEDIGETTDLAAAHPERVATMAGRLDEFLADCEAVTPKLNPNWNPDLAELGKLGWRTLKNCEFVRMDDFLRVNCTGEDPFFRIQFDQQLPAGVYTMIADFERTTKGPVEIRWAEEGVKPAFGPGRKAGIQREVEIEAKRPMTQFRVDPGSGAGAFDLRSWKILRDGEVVRFWNFAY